MKAVWIAGMGCLIITLIGVAEAQDKKAPDKAKLIGIWEVVKSVEAPPGATIEFTRDGKLTINATIKDKTLKIDGTYKVEGNKLITVTRQGKKDINETMTIQTLTDTTLVTVDEKGQSDEFKRKKK